MALEKEINHLAEILSQSPPEIQELLAGEEINKSAATLGKLYALPITDYLPLKNIITFTILGVISPDQVVSALQNKLILTEEVARKLADDLDKSIFQKARIKILGQPIGEVKTITLAEGTTPDELRKEILDTTKRESALVTSPVKPNEKGPAKVITQGSRAQLMEQLDLLGKIPSDEEITARLAHIQSQISAVEPKVEETREVEASTKETLTNIGDMTVAPEPRAASYSAPPTKYNVDPYREIA